MQNLESLRSFGGFMKDLLEIIYLNIYISSISVLFIAIVIIILLRINLVKRKSSKINDLIFLNSQTKFNKTIADIYFFENMMYKSKLDNLNGDKVLKKMIDYFIVNLSDFKSKLNLVYENQAKWSYYNSKYDEIKKSESIFSKRGLKKIENRILRQKKLIIPKNELTAKYRADYVSPKGKVHRWWDWEYSFDDVKLTMRDAENEIEYRKSKERFKKVQRSKISDSVRFKVFQRDNYRCKICGRSPESNSEVTLHVDHIFPVSKGGSSDFSNLQTLCSSCNMGKKAKLM